jgi:hypothetical protein
MTERITKSAERCSECGSVLTVAFYGYGDCGMHIREEYEAVQGHRIDATDGMGDWEDGPTWLWVSLDKLPPITTFYMTKDRCCGRPDLDPGEGETDYCPTCREVMEPAKGWAAAVLAAESKETPR